MTGPDEETAVTTTETFQITAEQAELYQERFVPALFQHWVGPVLDAAGVGAGSDVLDVACGTGVVARSAADRVGPTGSVTGVDLNPTMLAVASRLRPDLTWRQGDVAALPFDDAASTSSPASPPPCSSPTSSRGCGTWPA